MESDEKRGGWRREREGRMNRRNVVWVEGRRREKADVAGNMKDDRGRSRKGEKKSKTKEKRRKGRGRGGDKKRREGNNGRNGEGREEHK